jgi:hypothetical protein
MNRYRVTWVETWGEVAAAIVEANDMAAALNASFSPTDVSPIVAVNGGQVNGESVVKIELLLETEAERGGGQ